MQPRIDDSAAADNFLIEQSKIESGRQRDLQIERNEQEKLAREVALVQKARAEAERRQNRLEEFKQPMSPESYRLVIEAEAKRLRPAVPVPAPKTKS